MAERKQAPVTPPVEPSTRRGRRKLDDVVVGSVASKAKFDEKQRQTAASRRAKTAAMAERDKQAALKAKRRAARLKQAKAFGLKTARTLVVVGPIVAPMSVAWTGQAGFAMRTLGWTFAAGILYAAAYELTTVFCAWMHHEARKDGDKGWEYRIATWLFGFGAAVQQWWHYSVDWHATPRSVTFASMTIIGVMVWELYSRLIHRRALRAQGRISESRPRLGLARWIRYPRLSFTAWSISIGQPVATVADLWILAETSRTARRTERTLKREIKDLKSVITDLQNARQSNPGPAPLLNADQPDLEWLNRPDPQSTPDLPELTQEIRELEAGPPPADPANQILSDPQDPQYDGFVPTDLERGAVALLLHRGERLNRTTCAEAVRQLQGAIATKRAADLAKWGRENHNNGLKAV